MCTIIWKGTKETATESVGSCCHNEVATEALVTSYQGYHFCVYA